MDRLLCKQTYEADLMTLVKMVEERPCIWDKSCLNEPGERRRAWKEICQHFAPGNLDDMEAEERTKLEDGLQLKWKNTKDTFFKSIRNNSTQQYKHHNMLKFLMKNLNSKPQSSPQPPVQTGGKSSSGPRAQKRLKKVPLSSGTHFTRKRGRPRTVRANSPALPEKDEKLESPPPETSSANNGNSSSELLHLKDEDEAFFISVIPSIKKFSDDEKLEFRIGVLSNLREIIMRSKMENTSAESNSNCAGYWFVDEGDLSEVRDEINVCD